MRNTRSSIVTGINPMGAGMVAKLKKIGLSLSVIILFALYAGQRQAQTGSTAGSIAALYEPSVSALATVMATVAPQSTAPATNTPPTTAAGATERQNTSTAHRSTVTASATATATAPPDGAYKDGTYTGSQADAHWGTVEVVAVITNGQLSDVQFVQYPNHRDRSKEINYQAMPMLTQEAIQSQQADVDIISGATDTSEAFITSLSSALTQAAS